MSFEKGDPPEQLTSTELLTEEARAAALRNAWDEAARLWTIVRERSPDVLGAYFEHAHALTKLEQFDAAEATFAHGMARFPKDPWLAIHHSWMAMHQADWQEAARRWAAIRDRFPDQPFGYHNGGLSLQEAGRFDEAELVLAAGAEKFPDNIDVLRYFALNADHRRSSESVARWENLCRRFPDDDFGRMNLQRVKYHALWDDAKSDHVQTGSGEEERATRGVSAAGQSHQAGLEPSRLAMQFESLGQNCEFGLVQRYFGAEPLSLFRFSATNIDMLTSALDSHFEGVGTVEQTMVTAHPGGELVVEDKRFFKGMHTPAHRDSVDMDVFLTEMRQRLIFLKRRLLEILRSADKVFVCVRMDFPERDAVRLLGALRRYGPNRLLCVRSADEGHPSGTVEQRSPDLVVGYVNLEARLGLAEPFDHLGSLDYVGWTEVCRKAYAALNRT